MSRPPFPPFTHRTTIQQVRMAEACSTKSRWRDRSSFLQDCAEIKAFLPPERPRAFDCRPFKGLRALVKNSFAHEWRNENGQWFRSHGNENGAFDAEGLMHTRIASINDLPIADSDRKYHWPIGRRPDDHPGLSRLGL